MEYSYLKTLAAKFKITISKVKEKYCNDSKEWAISHYTKVGRKLMYFAEHQCCVEKIIKCDDTTSNHAITFNYKVDLKQSFFPFLYLLRLRFSRN